MSPEERRELVRVAAQVRFSAGPLPPPEALERYNQILPGAADRIIKMAESQHDHRQELEKTAVKANVAAQKTGLWLGFIVAMTAICGGIWLASHGKSGAGVTSIIAALAALVGVFVYGKMQQSKELAEKAGPLEQSENKPPIHS